MTQNKITSVLNTGKERNPLLISETSLKEININENKVIKLFDWRRRKDFGFSVTKYKDNDLFFTEGNLCEYYSINEFYPLPSTLVKRVWHSSINYNNNIYCCGGVINDNYNDALEVFDLNHMKWLRKSSMKNGRYGFGLIEYDGFLYAIDGSYQITPFEKYDPRTDEWINVPIVSNRRRIKYQNIKAIVDRKNRIFVTNPNEVWQYNLKNNAAELVKTYNISSFSTTFCPLPFVDQENLYLYCRDDDTETINWLKLNENIEQFEPVPLNGNEWTLEYNLIL